LKTCVATMGWGKYDLWPSSALSDCSVQVVKAVRVVSADSKANTNNQIIDVLWTKQSFTDDLNVNLSYIVRHLAARSHQRDGGGGHTITVFVVQVLRKYCGWLCSLWSPLILNAALSSFI
jgi:hypothetical protein